MTDSRADPEARRSALPAALAAGLATLLACAAIIHSMPGDAYWASDCASRALLAQRLVATNYSEFRLDYPAAIVDLDGIAFPLAEFAYRDRGSFTSIYPLAFPALAAPFLALAGPTALRWPAALGTAACATLFALWIAPCVGRRRAALAGLVLGLATPLLFYGAVVWEHSLTVALSLFAFVLAAGNGGARLGAAGALLGMGCWLREELVLMVIAFALARAALSRRPADAVAVIAGAAPPLALLATWNLIAYGDPMGPHVAAFDPETVRAWSLRDLRWRVPALIVGFGGSARESLALAAIALAAAGIAAAGEWRGRPAAGLIIAAALGVGVWLHVAARALAAQPLPGLVAYNGFVAHVPAVCLAGAGAVRLWRDPALAPVRAGAVAGLVFALAGSATGLALQSVFGTGLHAGPRLLLPALPALLCLALLALPDRTTRGGVAGIAMAALLVAGAAASARSVWLLAHQATETDALQRALRARPERFVVSGDAPLMQLLAGVWHDKALVYAPRPEIVRRIATALRARGETAFLALAPEATPLAHADARCRVVAKHEGAVIGYTDTALVRCELASPTGLAPPATAPTHGEPRASPARSRQRGSPPTRLRSRGPPCLAETRRRPPTAER